MSENKKTTKTPEIPAEHEYPVEELILNCQALTGYKKEVAAGALFDCEKKKMTKTEFKTKVKDFLKKKVDQSSEKEVK